MKSITLFSSNYATAFKFYVLFANTIGFCLTENIDLLLSISSGLIVSSKLNDLISLECSIFMGRRSLKKLDKTKVGRLTKTEQGQYVIP